MYLALAFTFLVGCKAEKVEDQKPKEEVKETGESSLITYKDDAGRDVEIPMEINTIAQSGPISQKVILGLAPEKIVAVSSHEKNETNKKILGDLLSLPEVGQFYGKGEFNAEALAAANPEILLDIWESKKTVVEDMDGITEKSGKPALFIEMTFENAGESYRKLGKFLGTQEKAEKLATYVDRVNSEIKEGMEKVGEKKLSFVFLLGENGLEIYYLQKNSTMI